MKVLGGLCVSACALMVASGHAVAQIPTPVPAYPGNALGPAAVGPEGQTVLSRPRPDYDPLGIRLGSFIVHPTLGLTETYDSNVFATQNGAKSDFYTTENPGVSVASDWNRHSLAFTATGQFKQYATHSSENVNNAAADLRGRYDISNGQYFIADGGYALQHEDRASPDSTVNQAHPTEYHVTGAYLAYVRELARIGLRVDSTVTSYDFNSQFTSTGILVPENDRDRIEYVVAPRVSYEFIPGYQAFVRAVGNLRQYNQQDQTLLHPDPGDFRITNPSARRNSKGYELDAGTAIEVTRLITAEVYVGFLHQEYEAQSQPGELFHNFNGPAFGGNLLWNVTPLTSIKGSFSQSVAETTLVVATPTAANPFAESAASGSRETNFQLTVEHELLRNLLLTGSVGYVRDAYSEINRTDDTFGGAIGARYLMNRNIRLTADVSYSKRDSNVPGAGYDRVIGIVGATVGF
ncbi:MAG TPA: outer membrane beta-barrel protein [Stellaceae bacterium]|nr:outer membrane beta-barrel protein [Stellaceae bacterium]